MDNKKFKKFNQKGFGITELLVSVMIFSLVLLSISAFSNITLVNLGTENQMSSAARELRTAMNLLSSELRMGASVSPYLPGNTPATVNCLAQIVATSTTIKFLVVHDDNSVSPGIQPYYVGYSYDSINKQLLRGEVAALSTTSCGLPGPDPLSIIYSRVLADKVTTYDSNGDGLLEPVFALSNGMLTVNLAVDIKGANKSTRSQGIKTTIFTRTG